MSPRVTPDEASRGGLSPVEIADRIKILIERKTFRPGDRLKELELVERFASSRSPVREALRILEVKGLVKIEANRGATVARLSEDELEEILDMRGMMFRLAARRAVERASAQDRAYVAELAGRLGTLARQGDEAAFVKAHDSFIATIFRIGRCRRIAEFICETMPGLPQSPGPIQLLTQSPAEIADHLARFAEAMGREDATAAETLIGEAHAAQARLLKRLYRELG